MNVRNVFRNIELCLGCNIMTLEHVLGLMWREIAKNVWKKFQKVQNRHFFWEGVWISSMDPRTTGRIFWWWITGRWLNIRRWYEDRWKECRYGGVRYRRLRLRSQRGSGVWGEWGFQWGWGVRWGRWRVRGFLSDQQRAPNVVSFNRIFFKLYR